VIVRSLADAAAGDRRIVSSTWESVRLLLKDDRMGFSMHVTTIYPGTTTAMWYRNHLEAVLCIEGEGEVETLADGKIHPVFPGMIYALDQHDKHILRARTALKMVCVFNPPLNGKEVHDDQGAYPLEAETVR
jgi:L-ectoine synthase